MTPSFSDADVIGAVRLSMGRSAAAVRKELTRGLNGLASIASTAPLFGFFGTCLGIFNAFRNGTGEKTTLMLRTLLDLSDALIPIALGLLVAIPTLWFYRYLSSQVEIFDVEIESASGEVLSYVALQLRKRNR